MKRFLNFVGCLLVTLLVLTSCDKIKEYNTPSVEKPSISEYIEEAINPLMTSVDEVMIYQAKMAEECMVNDIFCDMSQEMVRNIATVLIKQHGSVTKKDIVMEYQTNPQIYDNLPSVGQPSPENPQPAPDTPATKPELPNLPPPSTIIKTEDDTVNGIPVIVTTKTEKTYEQK